MKKEDVLFEVMMVDPKNPDPDSLFDFSYLEKETIVITGYRADKPIYMIDRELSYEFPDLKLLNGEDIVEGTILCTGNKTKEEVENFLISKGFKLK